MKDKIIFFMASVATYVLFMVGFAFVVLGLKIMFTIAELIWKLF